MSSQKTKLYLDVPYQEKDRAKELGAWWDPDRKEWFVPVGKDVEVFERWFVKEGEEDSAKHPHARSAS